MFRLGRDDIDLEEPASIAVAVAALAFGFAGIGLAAILKSPTGYMGGVLLGAVAGFIAHEYSHRYVAARQGCLARFVLSRTGLLITFVSGLLVSLGVPFAILAPGYVRISFCMSQPREEEIAAAGPLSNIALALAALVAARLYGAPLLWGFEAINAWFALFNLLPFYPLDGSKIFSKNLVMWLLLVVIAAYLSVGV